MLINNVSELNESDMVQYIGNTLGLFGKLMQVVSVNTESNQCHIKTKDGGHYLSKCDVNNIWLLKKHDTKSELPRGARSLNFNNRPWMSTVSQIQTIVDELSLDLTLPTLERASSALNNAQEILDRSIYVAQPWAGINSAVALAYAQDTPEEE